MFADKRIYDFLKYIYCNNVIIYNYNFSHMHINQICLSNEEKDITFFIIVNNETYEKALKLTYDEEASYDNCSMLRIENLFLLTNINVSYENFIELLKSFQGFDNKIKKYEDYLQQKQQEELEELINRVNETYIREKKSSLENAKYIIERAYKDIKKYSKTVQILSIEVEALEKGIIKFNVKDEFKKISEHKSCEKIEVKDQQILITTNPLIIYEPIKEKYYNIGKIKIYIPVDIEQHITIYGVNVFKPGLWGEEQCHPHIASDGYVCFGNIEEEIMYYREMNQFYPLFCTLISFLTTVNIEDDAGKHIVAWDEVDAYGNIISYGTRYDEYYEEEDEEEDEDYDEYYEEDYEEEYEEEFPF